MFPARSGQAADPASGGDGGRLTSRTGLTRTRWSSSHPASLSRPTDMIGRFAEGRMR
ncbi:hypothetical protein C791_3170 [Amycolatopsis azurea DSM 43854]|uniref:Uncharacterized protein n=1 Tax=Amycolatopsis azurea DSM 43854 TaxID=1238180 RepID=M2QCQ4_9PSEU|nr:hypothetical protein C791_3170 [Amycolatopsis azurea DSM 43854]